MDMPAQSHHCNANKLHASHWHCRPELTGWSRFRVPRRHSSEVAASSMPHRLQSILDLPARYTGVLMDQFGVSCDISAPSASHSWLNVPHTFLSRCSTMAQILIHMLWKLWSGWQPQAGAS